MVRLARLFVSAFRDIVRRISIRADDVKAAGEWRVTFVVLTGTKSVSMIVNQHTASDWNCRRRDENFRSTAVAGDQGRSSGRFPRRQS
jgi:hypothetical protein